MDSPPTASSSDTTVSPEVMAMLNLMQQQMQAAADREARLTAMLTAQTNSSPALKPIAVERPLLLSSATLADFSSWEEAWEDYSRCQLLSAQPQETRVSALRQAFDADIRRYIREGIIPIQPNDDTPAIISAVKAYVRRQRNSLLDRIEFYSRNQQAGESFDSFFTCLKELFHACDFPDTSLLCGNCKKTPAASITESLVRDRVVVGIYDDETRHKLLSTHNLQLSDAIRICRAEEAAKQTGESMPTSVASINAVKSQYQQRKAAPHSDAASQPSPAKCPHCGRSPHTKAACPARGKTCNACKGKDHFERQCPQTKQPSARTLASLKLFKATASNPVYVPVDTTLNTEATATSLSWIPDTGSDVDAIGLHQLSLLGGFPENLHPDGDIVTGANNQQLESAGQISATLTLGDHAHITTIHVYPELSDALLSRDSLRALGLLPSGWPIPNIARPDAKPAVTGLTVSPHQMLYLLSPDLIVSRAQLYLIGIRSVQSCSTSSPMCSTTHHSNPCTVNP